MDFTKNFGLKMPSDSDFFDINDFNENAEIIDENMAGSGNNTPLHTSVYIGNALNGTVTTTEGE